MFRPNRIGTPFIYQTTGVSSSAVWTPGTDLITSSTYQGNVINSVPLADFGRSYLHWAGTPVTLPANSKMSIGQSFTVNKPIAGDTVGVEIEGGLVIDIQAAVSGCLAVPIFGKMQSLPGALLGPTTLTNPSTFSEAVTPTSKMVGMSIHYKTQFVLNDAPDDIEGTYFHGIMLQEVNGGPVALTISYLLATMAVRQLNDQQGIGYRDTLR